MPELSIPRGLYVDRGDPGASDFTTATLTTDGLFHDLDLSAIVPKGATAVSIFAYVRDGAVNSSVRFRKKGNVGTYAINFISTQAINVAIGGLCVVALDENAIIEYAAANLVFINLSLTVLGWWLP